MATSTIIGGALHLTGAVGDDLLVGDDSMKNVIYGGAGNDTIIGGSQSDTLVGEAGKDILHGGAGDDGMWGGGGDDMLYGGLGNDFLSGDGGNDLLDGGAGDDTMLGGTGNDVYVVDSVGDQVIEKLGEGIDTVQSAISYHLTANVENLTLSGSTDINGFGNELDNSLTGNSGNNILDGGAGNDTMIGGAGNDTYVVDSLSDQVVESAGGGIDTVQSSISYQLSADLENLTLTGSASINGTGTAADNVIQGNSANNSLTGGAGNDTILGGAGNDNISGGDGDDSLDGGDGTDALNGGAGKDTILGGAGNDGIYGGGSDDRIFGGDGNDRIFGDGNNDFISGGAGNDIMTGGQQNGLGVNGADTFAWGRADIVTANGTSAGFDHITDFGAGDRLDLSAVFDNAHPTNFTDILRVTDGASGTVISADVGDGHFMDVVVLDNVHDLSLDDLVHDHILVV